MDSLHKGPVMWCFDVFFYVSHVSLNRTSKKKIVKFLMISKTPPCSCDVTLMGALPTQSATNTVNISMSCRHHGIETIDIVQVPHSCLPRKWISTVCLASLSGVNPLRAKFFRGNINIYLHFVSFLHIGTTQVVEILPQIRQEPTYSIQSISWPLMSWQRKEPGHQQPWYWPS